MKKNLFIACVIAVAASLASCSITKPLSASSAPIGNKRGVSTATVVFGLYFNKNFGIAEAAKNGGITGAIATVDEKTTNYFLFAKRQIIVQGN